MTKLWEANSLNDIDRGILIIPSSFKMVEITY